MNGKLKRNRIVLKTLLAMNSIGLNTYIDGRKYRQVGKTRYLTSKLLKRIEAVYKGTTLPEMFIIVPFESMAWAVREDLIRLHDEKPYSMLPQEVIINFSKKYICTLHGFRTTPMNEKLLPDIYLEDLINPAQLAYLQLANNGRFEKCIKLSFTPNYPNRLKAESLVLGDPSVNSSDLRYFKSGEVRALYYSLMLKDNVGRW